MMKSGVLVCVLSAILGFSTTVFAQVKLRIFDWDNTLVENRQSKSGTFSSKIIIYRINQRLNLLQTQADGPEELHITQQDYKRIESHLGKGEGRPGSIGREVELDNGLKIQPADYYMRNPDSYRFFREGNSPKENHILNAFKEAELNQNGVTWQGPLWKYFVELCSTQEGADSVIIATARGHSTDEWDVLFDYMVKKRYIRFKPNSKRVYNLNRPEFDHYSGQGGSYGTDLVNVPERKAALVDDLLESIRRIPLPNGEKHEVLVADDDQLNLEAIAKVFRSKAFGNRLSARMILVNAGNVKEVRESSRPEVSYIEPGSKTFVSLKSELYFLGMAKAMARIRSQESSTEPVNLAKRTCEGLFAGGL